VCPCGLPVHAKCIQQWIDAHTNNLGQVVIHDRDTCSACKGKLNMQEIDRVSREDDIELDAPGGDADSRTRAQIRRAIEGCNAAVRNRMTLNPRPVPDEPYRINNAPSNGGGRYATQPLPMGPVPGTGGVPRTMVNVAAFQEARASRRLGRMSEDRTRNNRDRVPGRAISERQAESNGAWTRRYLANNSFAIDPSAFPDANAAGEQHGAVAPADRPHGQDGDENLFSTERTAQIGGTQDTEAGGARSSSVLRRGAPGPSEEPAREDIIVWREEWTRQSLAMAPKRLPAEHAAE
jgi:hypothetical protein